MGHSTFDADVEELATRGYHTTELLLHKVLTAVNEKVPHECTHKLYAALLMAAAPLKYMATLIAHGENSEDKYEAAGKETMLVAALLTARVVFPSKDGETIEVNFTPRNIIAAIQAAEKVAEKDLSPFLDMRMVEEYKGGAAQSGESTFGYWDYLHDVGPNFDNFGEDISKFATNKTKH